MFAESEHEPLKSPSYPSALSAIGRAWKPWGTVRTAASSPGCPTLV